MKIGNIVMNLGFLRRKFRLVLLIVLAGTIYICFQLFSLQILNISGSRDLKHANRQNPVLLENILNFERKRIGESEMVQHHLKGIVDKEYSNMDDMKALANITRGILVSMSDQYRPSENGTFQCLKSKEMIPFSSVNDDYCDCGDSSDEPGTAACPASQFYCTFQNLDIPAQFVRGSHVNDGVCDCCDGSDEWAGISVVSWIHLSDKQSKDILTHTPCNDICKTIHKVNEEDAQIRALGKRLRQLYIDKARHIDKREVYGPLGVFYKLSTECFEFDTQEYKYKLCPFKSVSQLKSQTDPISIGKVSIWLRQLPGHYIIKMDRGDLYGCPGGVSRNTLITFICGLTDKIVQVAESEKCSYSMKFSTPAAC